LSMKKKTAPNEMYLRKMDSDLRHLLQMSNSDIIKAVKLDGKRLAEWRRDIDKLTKLLTKNATKEYREAIFRLQMKRYHNELIPNHKFASARIAKHQPVRFTSIVKFCGSARVIVS